MSSLGTVTRALIKNAKRRFPGAKDSDVNEFVLRQFAVAVANPKASDDILAKLANEALESAADEGQDWALALQNSFRDAVIKPLVDKAKAKDVDPVTAIVYDTDLNEAEARAMLESLENSSSSADAPLSSDDDDYSETAADADSLQVASV